MPLITARLEGGFGNRLFLYAAARSYAELHGCELQVTGDFWLREIFGLETPQIDHDVPDALDYLWPEWDGKVDLRFTGTFCHQRHILYTRSQVKKWFTIKPEMQERLSSVPKLGVAAHRRLGDYVGRDGFVVISKASYEKAMREHGYEPDWATWITEETPFTVPSIPPGVPWGQRTENHPRGIHFLPDFWAMMHADTLFRALSTFSWWAATIGENRRVFSPDGAGLPYLGGDRGEQDCPFVEGNHVRVSHWWDGASDLHLQP